MFCREFNSLSCASSSVLRLLRSRFTSRFQPKTNLHNTRRIMNRTTTNNRGQLIVFEGLDRCGKSTQSKKLEEAIKKTGQLVQLWAFPDRTTKLGTVINDYLGNQLDCDDRAIHLIFSANRWEKVPALLNLLNSGTTVIIDRYAFSGVAYSAAKGLPLNWCKNPDVGLPKPDCVIFLQLSSEVAKERAGFGEERYEKAKFQDKVREQFEQIQDETWTVIDADQTIEELHEKIYTHISALKIGPLKGLWSE